jgi:hypothetical protein
MIVWPESSPSGTGSPTKTLEYIVEETPFKAERAAIFVGKKDETIDILRLLNRRNGEKTRPLSTSQGSDLITLLSSFQASWHIAGIIRPQGSKLNL